MMRSEPGRRRRLRGVAILVHNIDAVGGMERQATRLAERLAARGLHVTIVSTYHPKGFSLPLPRHPKPYEVRAGVEIVRIPMFDWWTYEAALQLVDAVATYVLMRRRRKVDLIYAVQFTGGVHAAHVAEATGLPVAVKFACGGEHGDFQMFARQPDAKAIREALGKIDRYVCISDEIRREAEAAGLDPARFVKIRNGVDTSRYSRDGEKAALPELGSDKDRAIVLFVGRHHAQKRVDVLLRAFARVVAEVPGARLACAGEGPLVPSLQELARTLGIADKVAFLGARPDVPALHRAASVFVLPSASEGLPNALLEALASGTPSVATDIPGTDEVVTHEREALLVPLDDEVALARAIVRLLLDRELASRLVAAGHETIAREYDMEGVTDRYLELFAEATSAARPLRWQGLLRLYARLGWAGARFVLVVLWGITRSFITKVVVGTKRVLGIKGDILP